MDDMISRAAAVRALASSNGDYLDALGRLEKIPAVDAAPVVHGRWIDENPDNSLDPRMRCSICTGVESPLIKWRYCPNCGAKMDGERRSADDTD